MQIKDFILKNKDHMHIFKYMTELIYKYVTVKRTKICLQMK